MTTNPQSTTNKLSESSINISDITRIMRKYGVYLLGLALLGGTLATIWAKFQTPQYDAETFVHLDQHSSISIGSGGPSDEYGLKMMTQIIGFQNPNVAVLTMRKLGLQKNLIFNGPTPADLENPVQRDQLVQRFEASLSVSQVPKSELLSIKFRSRSPALAAVVVNTLVDTYLEESFEQRYRSTKDITGYMTTQTDALKGKIQTEQNDLLNAEAKLGILAQSATSDSSLLLSEMTGLLSERVKVQGDRFIAQAEYQNMVNHPDASISSDVPGAGALNGIQSEIASTEAQVSALEDKYGPNYQPLQQAQAQLASLKRSQLDIRSKALKGAAENLERAQKSEQSISDRLQTLQKESEGRAPDTVRYEILKAQYISDQTLYNVLLTAMGTGAIQAGMQSQELNRFSTAQVPGIKSYPNVRVDAMAGTAAGLLVALLIVGIIVMNSDTVQTVDQIEDALPLPILASVPEYKEDLAEMRISDEILPLVTLLAPRSAGTEAYRLLRTAITLMPVSQKHRVISLTSCGPGEGKSTTSLNLAVVLATQSKRVLLIDADLRKPTIAQRLKLPATDQPGLSRFLSDTTVFPEECIQKVPEVTGLDVITVQEVPPFPSELLGQGRLEELLTWARDHYDYVLIDTPPVLLVTDALIVASHCDTLLIVVRIGVAQKRALRRIRQDLAKYPGKQTGIVVNALPHSDTYYGGYGNYRKYYGGKGYGGSGSYYGSGSATVVSKK
ncbi:polysaccharide biosynthesis tyrosine autokinase [Acidicapsa ligni]|uniref:polysaccharide biosynthesis tyrosine autokinase n=1 Tax=Acidicapsa ligni TaxID=542300 RepID=UPI0021E0A3BA|nr:polysaccharide biosynthesis tyrosine autokinase [Acidicapsa ligni]